MTTETYHIAQLYCPKCFRMLIQIFSQDKTKMLVMCSHEPCKLTGHIKVSDLPTIPVELDNPADYFGM